MDAVVDYLPSPLDVAAVQGENPYTGETESRPPEDVAPYKHLWTPDIAAFGGHYGRMNEPVIVCGRVLVPNWCSI